MARRMYPGEAGISAVIFAAAFLSYLHTMRPACGWLDASELATAAWFLGIGHNPGYPTFMLLAHPFRWLPLGSAAWRMNLFSVVCGAVAVVLAYLLARRLCGHRAAAAAAALTVGCGRTLWDLTTEIEVYALHACLMLGLLLCLVAWRQQGGTRRLAGAGLLWGLGMGNHPLTVALLPVLVAMAAGSPKGRARRLAFTAAMALAGLLVYLYIPIRAAADPPPGVNNPHTPAQFWQLLTAPAYREFMFNMPAMVVLARFGRFLLAPAHELTPLGMSLGLLGLVLLWRRDRLLAAMLVVIVLLVAGYAAGYQILDIYAYLLPTYLVWALWLAVGAAAVISRLGPVLERLAGSGASLLRPGRGGVLVAGALLCLPAWLWGGNLRAVDAHQDYSAHDFARAALEVAAPGALIIGDWYDIAPLGFAKYVQGLRPDVHLSAAFSGFNARSLAAACDPSYLARFPAVYVVEQQTNCIPRLRERFLLVPAGPLLRLYVQGRPQVSKRVDPAFRPAYRFGGVVGLASPRLSAKPVPMGRNLSLHLQWVALGAGPARPLEALLALAPAQGGIPVRAKTPLAGGLTASTWRPGEVVREGILLYLPSDLEPGRYHLQVRVRYRGGWALPLPGGAREATVGSLTIAPRQGD